jgi:hypothetical protein
VPGRSRLYARGPVGPRVCAASSSAPVVGPRARYCPSCQTVIGRRRRFSGSRGLGSRCFLRSAEREAGWCSVEDSNPGCRCVGPMPLAAWRTERGSGGPPPPRLRRASCFAACENKSCEARSAKQDGSGGGIRTRTVASFEEADSADWSTPPRYWCALRDSNSDALRQQLLRLRCLPVSTKSAWCPPRGIEPGTCCLQGSCSAVELGGQKMNKRPRWSTGPPAACF